MFRIVAIVIFIIIFVLGAAFSAANNTAITINYYLSTITLPLSIVVVIATISGIIIGAFLLITSLWRLKYENRRLTKKISKLEQELDDINLIAIEEIPQSVAN
jgi:putative membrane protein